MMAAYDTLLSENLAGFLAGDYPKLRLYMGLSAFDRMAQRYASNIVSEGIMARSMSERLPVYLNLTRPYSRTPEIAELASLENAFNAALAAPDVPVATRPGFIRKNASVFSLEVHPSVQRLHLRTNVTSLWAALTAGELPPPPELLEAPQELLVWRQGLTPRFRILGAEEATALDDAARGAPTSLDHLSESFLNGWLEAEVIAVVRDMHEAGEK